MNKQKVNIKVGQEFPLTIKRIGINGEGVGFFKRQVVFVPGALRDEEIVAKVTKVSEKFVEAKIKTIRKQSKSRVKPKCPVYEECGGCQLQHLTYNAQLKEKRDIVKQAFERYTLLNNDELQIKETIGMENPWHYRNKSQLQVGKDKGKVITGLYKANSHQLIDISNCPVQHDAINKVTQRVKQLIEDLNIPIANGKNKDGTIRTIVTRIAFATGEIQLVLVTTRKEFPKKERLITEIKRKLPQVTSIAQNINNKKTSLIFGDETLYLSGKEFIQETMGELTFDLSARAFFQLNPVQTIKLYDEVKKAASLSGNEKVVDAYCGVGTIGLWLANEAGEIRGMDVIAEAIQDANNNAKKHGYNNTTYVVGKAETWLPRWVQEGWRPDVIVVDPPRTGCDEELLKTMIEVKPKRIVYVSCNPSTLAKDCAKLMKAGFKIEYVQPVDMFPMTGHVEAIALIQRKIVDKQ